MNYAYEKVTQNLIAKIEEAVKEGRTLPWQQPWTGANMPWRWKANKPYRGINLWLLEPGEYITFSQICDEEKKNPKVHLKKGSHGTDVIFFKLKQEKEVDENGKEVIRRKPIFKVHKVFNIKDCVGIEPRRKQERFNHEPSAEAEKIVDGYVKRSGIKLRTDGDSAYYRPSTDAVVVPNISRFKEQGEYYSTLFHELTHSTGHPDRLDRLVLSAFFGSSDYSREELVAEMGASMLCTEVGFIDRTIDNSAAYLQNWLNAIKADPEMLVHASSKAQKAVDYILDRKFADTEEVSE